LFPRTVIVLCCIEWKPSPTPKTRSTWMLLCSDHAAMESYAVIGGEGFVGAALMRGLAAAYPTAHVSSLGLTQRTFTPSYRFFHTDITSPASLAAAFKNSGATTVFHTASPHPTASKEMCEKVNVEGTQAVVQACWEAGITKLVYTSSVTVCFEGKDIKNADERLPVTESLDDAYVATKVGALSIRTGPHADVR
jgi:sterol-4alpha-carboxylate 3-dehydrogenase (decarboxylating)